MPSCTTKKVSSPQVAPSPPAASPQEPEPEPSPPDEAAHAETAGAVSRANEAGALDDDAISIEALTPTKPMTPRDLTSANNNVSTDDDDDDDEGEEGSLSDDESYTPSVGEESDDDDDDQAEWKIGQIKSKDFTVEFNVTDRYIEETYLQETKALTKNLIAEFATISGTRKKTLNEDELLNTYFPAETAVPILSFMNRNLQGKGKPLAMFPELQPFLRSFYGLCSTIKPRLSI